MNPSRIIARHLVRHLTVASLLLVLTACNSKPASRSLFLANQSDAAQPAVLEDQMRSDVYYLASDRLEGRGVGTEALARAADYIATRFKSLGLKPLPELGTYFQTFDITTAE